MQQEKHKRRGAINKAWVSVWIAFPATQAIPRPPSTELTETEPKWNSSNICKNVIAFVSSMPKGCWCAPTCSLSAHYSLHIFLITENLAIRLAIFVTNVIFHNARNSHLNNWHSLVLWVHYAWDFLFHVVLHLSWLSKGFITPFATVWLFTCMSPCMHF